MENHLESIKEAAESLEEMEPSRLRVVATLAVILVTAATVVATVLAAVASNNGAIAQRQRQEAQAHATADSLLAAQQSTAAAQQRDDTTEAEWRSLLFDQVATNATDPTVAAQLRAEAAAVQTQEKALARAEPSTTGRFTLYQDKAEIPATKDEQTAEAYAIASSGWIGQEAGDLATISIFAVALFLLGLALTLSSRRSASSFVGLALALLLVGAVRLLISGLGTVPSPSTTAIGLYVQGTQQIDRLENDNLTHHQYGVLAQQAEASLTRALAINPTYAVAWEALGNLTFQVSTGRAQYGPAITDLRNAISFGHPFPSLYNDVGYLQTLSRDVPGAMTTLRQALALDPTNVITLASLAEARVVAGDLNGANTYLARALHNVAHYGPEYQLTYFESFRLDRDNVAQVASRRLVNAFWTEVKNAEVSLTLSGQPTPGSAHGAQVTNVAVTALDGAAGQHGGSTVSFDYRGLKKGDIVSARWYLYDDIYEPAASSTALRVPRDLAAGTGSQAAFSGVSPLLAPGVPQTLEIFINGVHVTSYGYTPPGTPVN
jgi:tetratricopeptide (TPR) repeat protein